MERTTQILACVAIVLGLGLLASCENMRSWFNWNPEQRQLAAAVVDSLEARGKIKPTDADALRRSIEKTEEGVTRQELLMIALDAAVAAGEIKEEDAVLIEAAIRVFIRNQDEEYIDSSAEEAAMPDTATGPPGEGGQA